MNALAHARRHRLRVGIESNAVTAAAAIALLVLGAAIAGPLRSCDPGPPPAAPVIVQEDPEAYLRQMAALRRAVAEKDGLIGRLSDRIRGLESRSPVVITEVDTVVVMDTVILALEVDAGGNLALHTGVPTDTARTYRPRVLQLGIADCDDGIRIVGERIQCDRATFGHLDIFATAGLSAPLVGLDLARPVLQPGIGWEPSYRSLWRVELSAGVDGRASLTIRTGFRIW